MIEKPFPQAEPDFKPKAAVTTKENFSQPAQQQSYTARGRVQHINDDMRNSKIVQRQHSPRLTSPAHPLSERPQPSTTKRVPDSKHLPAFEDQATVEHEQGNLPRHTLPASNVVHPPRHSQTDPRTGPQIESLKASAKVHNQAKASSTSNRQSPDARNPSAKSYLYEYEAQQRRLQDRLIMKICEENEKKERLILEKDELISQHDAHLFDLAEKYQREKEKSAKKDAVIQEHEKTKSYMEGRVRKFDNFAKGVGNDWNYLRGEATKLQEGHRQLGDERQKIDREKQRLSGERQRHEAEAQDISAKFKQQIDLLKKESDDLKQERLKDQSIMNESTVVTGDVKQTLEALFNSIKVEADKQYNEVFVPFVGA